MKAHPDHQGLPGHQGLPDHQVHPLRRIPRARADLEQGPGEDAHHVVEEPVRRGKQGDALPFPPHLERAERPRRVGDLRARRHERAT